MQHFSQESLGHWLAPWEKEFVIKELLRAGLIKFDNGRNLPLKKGGTTDIYINLRDARNNPGANALLAKIYANALRRLNPDLFVEIPDAVSCFAGPLQINTNIPYLTIREQPKVGRVAKAKTIGSASFGQTACLIDDVITDGASKLEPYRECLAMGLELLPLLVLVDRQQGWEPEFDRLGINMSVWAGMKLHDVRKYLISNGIMERCKPELEEKNPLIVALDNRNWKNILPIIDALRTTGCILKVNDLLFAKGITNLISDLQVYGRVMADLKSHDIPQTVENIQRHLLPNPPWAVTVHGSGGIDMMKTAVKCLERTNTKVLAVTALTSLDATTCKSIYGREPSKQVLKIAEMANMAGCHGFVCSPQEVGLLKEKYPGKLFVTPGIRSPGQETHDQQRVDTPVNAMKNGATHLVMGRQILGASDPVTEVKRLLNEELQVM